MTQAYPLAWPAGWPRATIRTSAKFGTAERKYHRDPNTGAATGSYMAKSDLTMGEAVKRVRYELERLGVRHVADDAVISTNLRLNLSGLPRADQGEPGDPGVAVYWQKPGQPMKVMAIDRYTRVRDNLAAIAATLEAMRAIERHGGGQVLERAFTGFDALPAPKNAYEILGLRPGASKEEVERAWKAEAQKSHPDRPDGSHERMAEVNAARDAIFKQLEAT